MKHWIQWGTPEDDAAEISVRYCERPYDLSMNLSCILRLVRKEIATFEAQNESGFFKICLIFKISLLFIYFGCAGSALLHRAYSSLWCICFSSPWLLLWSMRAGCTGFRSCITRFSCPAACGHLPLDQRANPCPLHW